MMRIRKHIKDDALEKKKSACANFLKCPIEDDNSLLAKLLQDKMQAYFVEGRWHTNLG
jgi:hypothetical protein